MLNISCQKSWFKYWFGKLSNQLTDKIFEITLKSIQINLTHDLVDFSIFCSHPGQNKWPWQKVRPSQLFIPFLTLAPFENLLKTHIGIRQRAFEDCWTSAMVVLVDCRQRGFGFTYTCCPSLFIPTLSSKIPCHNWQRRVSFKEVANLRKIISIFGDWIYTDQVIRQLPCR